MGDMRRSTERVRAQVPVYLHDVAADGTTVDLSPNGIFIVTSAELATGQSIRFSIEFQNSAGPHNLLYLECFGEVVRVTKDDGKTGVGVRITESRLERRDRRASDDRRGPSGPERRRHWNVQEEQTEGESPTLQS